MGEKCKARPILLLDNCSCIVLISYIHVTMQNRHTTTMNGGSADYAGAVICPYVLYIQPASGIIGSVSSPHRNKDNQIATPSAPFKPIMGELSICTNSPSRGRRGRLWWTQAFLRCLPSHNPSLIIHLRRLSTEKRKS